MRLECIVCGEFEFIENPEVSALGQAEALVGIPSTHLTCCRLSIARDELRLVDEELEGYRRTKEDRVLAIRRLRGER